MLITEILHRNARLYENEIALVEREPEKNIRRAMTWKEFDLRANQTANLLIEKGVQKGDKIIHLMSNCMEWLPIYFGILRTGAWAAPLNFRFTAEEIQRCTEIAGAKVFIFGEEFIDRVKKVKTGLDADIFTYIFVGPEQSTPDFAEHYQTIVKNISDADPTVENEIQLSDEAALYFTSGTTGDSKAVLLTHRNLESACYVENRHHNQTHDDNFLCIPPLYHTGAKMHWFGNFIVGAKSVILKGVRPEWILEAVSEENVTIVWLLVPWAHDILIAIESNKIELDDYKLSQWRLMHIGAQPVPPSLIKKWKKVFPWQDYDTNYGLTEATGPGCVHLGLENIDHVGAIGKPGFDYECKIVGDDLELVPSGTPGELAVKGPGIMQQYYRNPEATEETLKDGWLLTGDVARMDEEGFIWLVDRKKDVIITGGENIYPVEVENFLMECNGIADAGVFGIPDERLGEIVACLIQIKPSKDLSETDIVKFCEGLPRYKRPRRIFFGDVPRNPTGKIEKPKLKKMYGEMK